MRPLFAAARVRQGFHSSCLERRSPPQQPAAAPLLSLAAIAIFCGNEVKGKSAQLALSRDWKKCRQARIRVLDKLREAMAAELKAAALLGGEGKTG